MREGVPIANAVSVDETKMKDGESRYGSSWGHDHRHDH
jgi:hypothetical protein